MNAPGARICSNNRVCARRGLVVESQWARWANGFQLRVDGMGEGGGTQYAEGVFGRKWRTSTLDAREKVG